MTYNKAANTFAKRRKGSDRKLLANNTYLYQDGNDFVVRLHSTNIVRIRPDGTYVLRHNGWKSKTTKDRMNAYAPVRIYQKNYDWFLTPAYNPRLAEGEVSVKPPYYYDGVVVNSEGFIIE